MLGKISTKIITIFLLIFFCLSITVIASFIAVDTQRQHIAITELIAAERVNMEKVMNLTDTISRTALASGNFPLDAADLKNEVTKGEGMVNGVISSLYDKQYRLVDGTLYTLKFRADFEEKIYGALDKINGEWRRVTDLVSFLTDSQSLSDLALYQAKYEEFREINPKLLNLSDDFVLICLMEANTKGQISFAIQVASILVTLGFFILLVFLIMNSFYKPFAEIRDTFRHMAGGEIQHRFHRKSRDEFKQIYDEFNLFIDNLNFIFLLEDKIIMENSINVILRYIYDNFNKFIPFYAIKLEFQKDHEIHTRTILNERIEENISIGTVSVLQDIVVDTSSIILPLNVDAVSLGTVTFLFKEQVGLKDSYTNFLALIRHKLSFAFYRSFLLKDLLGIVTTSLAKMAEEKDPETGAHLERMSLFTQIIARKLMEKGVYDDRINNDYINDISYAAPMHDIGKVSIPDAILGKPGRLTDEEFEIMKGHAASGGIVLDRLHKEFCRFNIGYFKMAADIAWGHQEKFDGTGYPKGLKGVEIPLSARICAVADVFDALSSKRPYKEAFPLEKCYAIMKESSGSHFDPLVLEAFFESLTDIEIICETCRDR